MEGKDVGLNIVLSWDLRSDDKILVFLRFLVSNNDLYVLEELFKADLGETATLIHNLDVFMLILIDKKMKHFLGSDRDTFALAWTPLLADEHLFHGKIIERYLLREVDPSGSAQ